MCRVEIQSQKNAETFKTADYNGKYWTSQEEQFIAENYKIMSDKDMAVHLKRTLMSVRQRRVKLNLHTSDKLNPGILNYLVCSRDDIKEITIVIKERNLIVYHGNHHIAHIRKAFEKQNVPEELFSNWVFRAKAMPERK